ncbi:MAG TPA: MGMT family protein [bacterium]|nr:MGMT family protein [bacterium]
MQSVYQKIYEAVVKIPRGKVATYGQIAKIVGTHPRVVGNALHVNPDPTKIPCHRVVDTKGKLAVNFGFGGMEEQAKRLRKEGVEVESNKVMLFSSQNQDAKSQSQKKTKTKNTEKQKS